MDPVKIANLLRSTIDPNQRAAAEEQLKQMEKIIGVAPALLQLVMSADLEPPIRQAGAIYLKNMIFKSWTEDEEDPKKFHIHEQDRAVIRDAMVDAAVHAPPLIRSQLCECIGYICRQDFPQRWSSLVDKIVVYLQSPEMAGWPGALSALRAMVKVFEYKKGDERVPLDEAMNLLLPLVQTIMVGLMSDASPASMMMQRLILKSFYALTQLHLPLSLLGEKGQWGRFQQWMELVRQVLDRESVEFEKKPEDEEDKDDLEGSEWWKTKKWAMRILYRMFERYGSPGSVTKEYKDFAQYYLNNYSEGAIQVVFKIMNAYRSGRYVGEKVMRDGILYLKNAVGHAHSWKFMKDHTETMLSDVIFPLMCHTDLDEKLWNEDPVEYIRAKYGECLEDESAVNCGEQFLNTMCKKRKGVLPKCIQLVTQILNQPNSTPQQKDGALHMVGAIADILLKKDQYKDAFDDVIIRFVFPSMDAPFPFIRSRAAWLMQRLSSLRFSREDVLKECIRLLTTAVLNKEEQLPVKVEAAFALESFIEEQHRSRSIIQPQVRPLVLEILNILKTTENDDLTNVLQRIVCAYVDEVAPIAIEICAHLASTFNQIMDSVATVDDSEKTIVAMGLLNTMETVLVVMEEQPEVCLKLEPILLQVVLLILEKSVMEFYEEAFSLIASLTEKQISPSMWQVYEGLYRVIERDGTDYFVEMMPTLHNYVTVDTNAFLADPNRLMALCTIIKKVLLDDSDAGEDAESHAAKLIEVLILQCGERIRQVIPNLLQLALERLNRPIKTSELRTMCLQVVVASLYLDLNLTQSVVGGMDNFVKQWIQDTDCFLGLHDRKVCVLGLCALLKSPTKPMALQECSKEILPSLILLFDGLKRAYQAKAAENAESESEEEEDDEDCEVEEILSDNEDDIDEESAEYLESLEDKINSSANNLPFQLKAQVVEEEDDDDDDDDDYSEGEETPLECYSTPLDDEDCPVDEFIIFKEVLQQLQQSEPGWYNMLTACLNADQQKSVQEIFTLADQRRAAAQSKEIQKKGGYEFRPQAVPTSFNFGNVGNLPHFGRP